MTDKPRSGASVLRAQIVLVAIALVCGLSIALVHELTQPKIEGRRGDLLGDAALDVLPGAVGYRAYQRGPDGSLVRLSGTEGAELFLGLDASHQPVGVALLGSGMGYQDTIRLVFGVDPIEGRLLGMRVIESRETPGLGTVIVDDADWVASFGAVQFRYDSTGERLPVRVRDQARPERGEIDAISGATVSVRAVVRIINESLNEWMPGLQREYEALGGGGRD